MDGDTGVELGSSAGRGAMPHWYGELLDSISGRISAGRTSAVLAANREVILTYWAIGKDILERQELEGWGAKVINRLSADLRRRYPDAKGFSPRNLRYMRTFAAVWPDLAIGQRSAAQLPWRHHQLLIDRFREDAAARLWYAAQAIEHGWSRDILDLQIDRQAYERSGKALTNFAQTLPDENSDLAQRITKDPYLLDFLAPSRGMHERQVEQGLMDHVENFLLELGQGFAFVGRQQRLTIGGEDFHLDLLFFHFKLNRFVVIELKATKFEAGFLGQLGTYMAAIDDQIKQPHHEPTIGLLLCKTKNDSLAEYALGSHRGPMGIAEWTDGLETSLPSEIAEELPTIEELEAELAVTDTLPGTGTAERSAATRRRLHSQASVRVQQDVKEFWAGVDQRLRREGASLPLSDVVSEVRAMRAGER